MSNEKWQRESISPMISMARPDKPKQGQNAKELLQCVAARYPRFESLAKASEKSWK